MQFRRSPSARPLDAEWHRERQRAREQAYSGDLTAQFSDAEITKYNLETAQIDGSDNARTWKFFPTIDILGLAGTDVRTLRDR